MDSHNTILVIEDSASQVLQIQLILNRAGYQVTTSNDGTKGWHTACQLLPDLVLLDINLPGIDGFRVLSLLKHGSNTSTIPVVILSSLDRISDVDHAVQLGADGYLFKEEHLFSQNSPHKLLDVVEQFLPKPLPETD